MTDSKALSRRLKIWRHNGFLGSTAMAIQAMRSIQWTETTTDESRRLAAKIEMDLTTLAQTLRSRR